MIEYKKNDKGIWLPLNASNLENNKKEVLNIRKSIFNIAGSITKLTVLFIIFINSFRYIIHNGNTNSDKINGFSKTEIQNLKLEFKPQDKDVKDIENPNTLYGYFAWNLGNTKVFCPQSVDFFKTNNQDERNAISQKYMQVDGRLLQPIGEYYFLH